MQPLHPYPFPKEVFSSLKSNLKMLRTLRLCWVDLSDLDFKDILLNCTSLEALSILGSETLQKAIIYGPPKLKFIEIRYCKYLVTVQVSAWKLETLVYYGYKPGSLSIFFAPKLHTVDLGDNYLSRNQIPLFPELSRVRLQLKALVLDFTYLPCQQFLNIPISEFPELQSLRWLELKVPTPWDEHKSLLHLIPMIKACPILHTCNIEFDWNFRRKACEQGNMAIVEVSGQKEKLEKLKKVGFRWFSGRRVDVELAASLLEMAPNVKRLVFDSRCPATAQGPFTRELDSDEDRMAARECARHLAANHAPNATLSIL